MTYPNSSEQRPTGFTGPTQAPMSGQQPAAPGPRPTNTRFVMLVVTSIVGGLALLGVASSALLNGSSYGPVAVVEQNGSDYDMTTADLYADLDGVTAIEIQAAAADFTLGYGDVDGAELRVSGSGLFGLDGENGWTLEQIDDKLIVERHRIGTLGSQNVRLTLPRAFERGGAADLKVKLSAGEFEGFGSFNDLDLEVNTGELNFSGAAKTVALAVRAGEADIELADVGEAQVSVSSGEADVTLTGMAPTNVALTARVGELTVDLPEAKYRVETGDVVGGFDNRLETSKDSKNIVTVDIAAAEVVLK